MKVRYVGDGSAYAMGVSTDPEVASEVPDEEAAGLIASGLYERVEEPKGKGKSKAEDAGGAATGGES